MKVTKFKIAIVIVISFILTILSTKYMFLPDSTDLQPKFLVNVSRIFANLVNTPQRYYLALKNFLSPKPKTNISSPDMEPSVTLDISPNFVPPTIQPTIPLVSPTVNPSNLAYIPFTQGISTSIDNSSNNKFLKIEAGTVVEVTEYTLVDGRRIQVIVPIK